MWAFFCGVEDILFFEWFERGRKRQSMCKLDRWLFFEVEN